MALTGEEWHYTSNNQKFGPVSSAELKKLAATGKLKPSDLIWKDGWDDWKPADKIKGLLNLTPPPIPRNSPSSTPRGAIKPNSPTSSHTRSSQESAQPALWNPFVARALSLVFSPIFGSLVIAKNWKTLGEDQKEERSMLWVYGFFANWFLVLFLPENVDAFFLAVFWVACLAWALTDAEKQIRFVKEKYGKDYLHKSWLTPVGLAIAGCVAYAVLFVAAEVMFAPD